MIRIERHPDAERIVDVQRMIEDLCRESDCGKWWSTDAKDVQTFIVDCLVGPLGYCAVAIDSESGETSGCLLGFAGELPFNHKVRVAREVILWADPKHRGKSVGETLVKDFVEWSREAGAELASIGSTYGFGEKHIKKIADGLGFELQETMYLRRA